VHEVIELTGLQSVARRRAGAFSLGMGQRLGIAAALLGDPEVLLFDEPVNGLDPEGILWIRRFMHRLADEGRTVFVSSHLLSEMALTAQELVVIGRGKLIAQCSTEEFVARATESTVVVRSPQLAQMRSALGQKGATVRDEGESLIVSGMEIEDIGDIAGTNGLTLHELSPQRGSLEEAFIQLTGDSVEYHAALSGDDGQVATDLTPAGK
jgi:ABC-2 type transport system ATP-binding protein